MASVASSLTLCDVEEHIFHMDHESALLVAELQLQEALELSKSSKGKAREGAPPTDQEIALRLQAEELSEWKQTHQDAIMAESIDQALGLDEEIIQAYVMMEETAAADRRAAELLQQAFALQGPSDVQKKGWENRTFNDIFGENTGNASTASTTGGMQRPSGGYNFVTANLNGSSPSSQLFAGPSVDRVTRASCASCADSFRIFEMLKAECNHHWCSDCLASVMEVYSRDESLHPLRCCQKAFSLPSISGKVKDRALLERFNTKRREYEVSAQDRVYCSRPTCSTFLGSARSYSSSQSAFGARMPGTATCPTCFTATCAGCRKGSHPGDTCKQNEAVNQLRALARESGWQTCPGCSAVIELNTGCYHITCRCRTQFCYLCAEEWKNCTCPQWEERHLLATAGVRAEHLMGGQHAREAQPEVFAQQLQRAVENIRANHGCVNHRWVKRVDGGSCEECGDYVPFLLNMCRDCNLLACQQCSLNRL